MNKTIEQKIFEQDNFFFNMASACLEPLIALNTEGKVFFWNKSAEETYGYSYKEAKGQKLTKLIVPREHWEIYEKIIQKVSNKQSIRGREFYIQNKDRKYLKLNFHINLVTSESEVLGIAILGMDLGKQNSLEASLKESENRFEKIKENVLEGLVIHSKGKILEINSAACQILACNPQQIISKDFLSYFERSQFKEGTKEQVLEPTEKKLEAFIYNQREEEYFVNIETWGIQYKKQAARVTSIRDISARQILEEQLKQQKNIFKELFEQHSAVMLLIDYETRKIIRANQAAVSFYGYSKEQFKEKYIDDLNIIPLKEVKEEMEKAKYRQKNLFHFKHILVNGIIKDVEVHSSPIHHEGRKVLFSIVHDITERKIAEEEKRKHEVKFRLLFEQSNDGIFLHTLRGDIIDVNQIACDILGYSREEILKLKTWELYPDVGQSEAAFLMKGGSVKEEIQMLCKDKNLIYVDISAKVMQNGIVQAVIRDITHSRKIEQALKESEQRFALAVEGTNDGIWDWNLLTNEVYYSKRWKEMLGYKPDELKNMLDTWENLTHPEDVKNVTKYIEILIKENKTHFETEFRMKHKKGHWVEIHSKAQLARNEQDMVVRMVGTHSDITERKNNEKKLRNAHLILKKSQKDLEELNEELKQKNDTLSNYNTTLEEAYEKENALKLELEYTLKRLKEAQSQFVHNEKMASLGTLTAGIAHEINNPVNFIQGSVDFIDENIEVLIEIIEKYAAFNESIKTENLKEINDFKKQIKYDKTIEFLRSGVQNIREGTKRTAEIVRTLHNFSRLDEASLKKVDIHKGIDSTLVLLQNKLKNKVTVVKNYDEKIPMIECHSGQINQVFLNIINNASQAMENKGYIYITSKLINAKEIEITIKDTGKGMSKDTKKHIFEPFFTTKPVGEGTGLGLSISHKIITQHEGELSVESELDIGTSFHIILPINQD